VSSTNPIQLAIISPCSSFKNQLSEAKNGRPPCPRRQIQQQKTELDTAGVPTQHLEHLTLTGREADSANPPASGDNDLRNPVYWNEGNAVLVWVATLADNGGVRGADDTWVSSHLLDPTFDTAYIQCHPLPVVPAIAEAAYFTLGAFLEGQQVEVRFSANQQIDLSADSAGTVLVDGFAQRVNFAFLVPRKGVGKDLVPAGT
jgi:hypothetical protein